MDERDFKHGSSLQARSQARGCLSRPKIRIVTDLMKNREKRRAVVSPFRSRRVRGDGFPHSVADGFQARVCGQPQVSLGLSGRRPRPHVGKHDHSRHQRAITRACSNVGWGHLRGSENHDREDNYFTSRRSARLGIVLSVNLCSGAAKFAAIRYASSLLSNFDCFFTLPRPKRTF